MTGLDDDGIRIAVKEIHDFCNKLDGLLSKIETAIPLFLSMLPPDVARMVHGAFTE